jgi:hypothetical protein
MTIDPTELAKVAKVVGEVGGIATLSKPLVKLLEVLENGIGAVGRPLMLIVNEHAQGRAKLVREGYAHRLRLLKSKHRIEVEAATLALPPRDAIRDGEIEVVFGEIEPAELLAAHATATEQELKRRANILTIAAEAADNMPGEVSDQPVEPDWTARFFTSAQDVSAEDLQRLWGKLLASEITAPGTVPVRTLELLRNLSPAESALFQKFATFCSQSCQYIRIAQGGLTQGERITLQDAELLEAGEERLAFRPIAKDDPDYARALAKFGDRYSPDFSIASVQYVVAEVPYISGQVLVVQAPSQGWQIPVHRVRPSALPLLRMAKAPPSQDYLRAVVDELNAARSFCAWIREPAGGTQAQIQTPSKTLDGT